MNFSDALNALKKGASISREGWSKGGIYVLMQTPDEHSKMTKPYMYMVKGDDKFPLDLSCESIFAEDWYIVAVSPEGKVGVNTAQEKGKYESGDDIDLKDIPKETLESDSQ